MKPKYARKQISNYDEEVLIDNLQRWATSHHCVMTGREEYFKEMMTSAIYFAIYCYPIPELHSAEMDVTIKIFFWLFYIDDILEYAVKTKVCVKSLHQGNNEIASILLGKYDNSKQFVDVPKYPSFRSVCNLLFDIHIIWKRIAPPGYERRVKVFHARLQRFFDCFRWNCIDEVDGRYSEATFVYFRNITVFMDGSMDVISVVDGVTLSDEIMRSPTLSRLTDIVNGFGAYTNDLCGMRKELCNMHGEDNLVRFKVLEKKIPLSEAVEQVCKRVEDDLNDYNRLKEVILKEFDYDSNLVRYLDLLDSLTDGHNMLYINSSRHGTMGSITLTE